MAKDEEKDEGKEGQAGAEGEAAPKSKKKLIIIIAAVVVVVLGAAAFFLLGGKKEGGDEHAEDHAEEHKHYEQAELAAFIVNLSETSNFLKVKLLIEYDPQVLAKAAGAAHGGGGDHGGGHGGGKDAGLPGHLGVREPMIQDSVIRVLSSKKAADVLTVEGKEQIKEELLEAINEASQLEEPAVVAIYFREFIVQ